MDDESVMNHLRNDNEISWVCQFCGHPFPWEVHPETFRHHLTRICESAPEDVKEAAQRREVEAPECSRSVSWEPTRILDASENNDSNFEAETEGSKYERQELQRGEEEVSSVGIVQSSNKRRRITPDALPIVAALEVPMVEGIPDIGESASLTKRPVGDAFKRNEEKMDDLMLRVGIYDSFNIDEGQLQKLKVTLRTVTKAVDDAEQKQFTDRHVQEWLDHLKDAAFRAEDLLDEVAYKVLKLKIESGGAQN